MSTEVIPAIFSAASTEAELAVVGAASSIDNLPMFREWLIAEQRDLELNDPIQPANLDAGNWQERATEMRRVLDGFTGRVGIHGPFLGLSIDAADPEIRAVTTRRFLQALEYGALLGATHMVIHSPFYGMGNPFIGYGAGSNLPNQIAHIHATLEPVVRFAESIGCILVIENTFDQSPFALLEVARSFDSETVRLSLDVGHAELRARHGGTPPGQWIRETGPYLAHLHLQDVDGEHDRHWAPGDGRVSWYSVFEALSTLDHRPRLILEMMNRHNVLRGFRYLHERGLAR